MTQELAQKIQAYIDANPSASRSDVAVAMGIYRSMLERMGKAGMVTLPRPLSYSEAARIGRKKAEASGKRFVINKNKPQVWQVA